MRDDVYVHCMFVAKPASTKAVLMLRSRRDLDFRPRDIRSDIHIQYPNFRRGEIHIKGTKLFPFVDAIGIRKLS